jgi:hypothetical protein
MFPIIHQQLSSSQAPFSNHESDNNKPASNKQRESFSQAPFGIHEPSAKISSMKQREYPGGHKFGTSSITKLG